MLDLEVRLDERAQADLKQKLANRKAAGSTAQGRISGWKGHEPKVGEQVGSTCGYESEELKQKLALSEARTQQLDDELAARRGHQPKVGRNGGNDSTRSEELKPILVLSKH